MLTALRIVWLIIKLGVLILLSPFILMYVYIRYLVFSYAMRIQLEVACMSRTHARLLTREMNMLKLISFKL